MRNPACRDGWRSFVACSGQPKFRKGAEGKKENRMLGNSVLGIDVGKATLACTLLDPASHQVVWEASYPNTPTGVQSLLERTPPHAPWVMEPTGRYSLFVAKLFVAKPARAAGRQ